MMLCSACGERYAVVFVQKVTDGRTENEGLCLTCAKSRGIAPISRLLEQTGITEEELDNLNRQMGSLMEGAEGNPLDGIAAPGTDGSDAEGGGDAAKALGSIFGKMLGGAPWQQRRRIEDKAVSGGKEPDQGKEADKDPQRTAKGGDKKEPAAKKRKLLEQFGINVTERAKNDAIDKVIGRDREIERVIQILNRRRKNNPVLIGEPGVGKTAIAEGLAVRVAARQVPAKIQGYEIYMLDLASIVAGTQFRGQFEARMKGIIEEVRQAGNVILVIDELHNIMGAGEAEGAMNAANILKPALARGEFQVIGATTIREYRRYIEKDAALERRFQPVMVDEPDEVETVAVLEGIKGYYESFHKVRITDDVVRYAVSLAARYINDRFLPDKAIDVIDEAASRANLRNTDLNDLESLREELSSIQSQKESAISADSIEDYQKAADLKVKECKLTERIAELEGVLKDVYLTEADIASVVESWTGIPVRRLTEAESARLLELEGSLRRRVVGQDGAIATLSKAIRRNRSGFKKRRKPCSFIFIGPTGVGKTELVKALAIELFGSEGALIRLDMSEYMERHTVSKLIGSPPGYVGYDDGGQLTERIRRKPYSVVLFDEVEKAHPDVYNMLLQILDDGRLTDSHGKYVSFENAVLVLTSNAGGSFKAAGMGFGPSSAASLKERADKALKEIFRPELLNRIDETIVFNELGEAELLGIADIMVAEVAAEAAGKGVRLTVADGARRFLIAKGHDAKYGARPLRHVIQAYVEDELSDRYIKGELPPGCEAHAEYDEGLMAAEGRLAWTVAPGAEAVGAMALAGGGADPADRADGI
ncbi:MAG: ATP-dependent Clp protease ATP-binding subunit [Oscillospiraceae bacterium]|nr:ATP-dependent Clp protease ATP-binding subunit [Oscillospiraceae bacterium]